MRVLSDTEPEAVRFHVQLLRAAPVAKRLALARELSRITIVLARRALRASHPQATETEIALRFVALHYGEDLAAGLRQHLLGS